MKEAPGQVRDEQSGTGPGKMLMGTDVLDSP